MLKLIDLPELTPDKVNIFLIQDNADSQALLHRYYAELSSQEKNKYAKYHFDRDKKLYLFARVLVKYTLAYYLNCNPENVVFELNEYGKPELKDSLIKFNLSHSGGVAALAISLSSESEEQLDLGVDTESIVAHKDIVDIAFNYFSPSECDILRATDKAFQKEMFYQFWTLKETYIKAIGKGLSIDLNSFGFSFADNLIRVDHFGNLIEEKKTWHFMQTRIYQEHVLALAIRKNKNRGSSTQYQLGVYEFFPGESCKQITLSHVVRS